MLSTNRSMQWALVLPVPIMVAIGIIAALIILPSLTLDNARQSAVETGSSIGAGAPLEEFMTFSRAMGFEEVWDFEREHATEI